MIYEGGKMQELRNDENNIVISNLLKLLTPKTLKEVLVKSLKIFEVNLENYIEKIVMLILSISIIALFFRFNINIVEVVKNMASVLLDTCLALFGSIFTGYALFQALLNKKLLLTFINQVNKNGDSMLQETNENFVSVMILFVLAVIINLLIITVMPVIPTDFCLLTNLRANNIMASILLLIYIYFFMQLIWEVINFIFNIYQLFNCYAVAIYKESLSSKDE